MSAQGFGSDPLGNTGSNSPVEKNDIRLGVDWVNASTVLPSKDDVLKCMEDVASLFLEGGGLVVEENKGFTCGRYFPHSGYTPAGSRFGFRFQEDTGTWKLLVSIPGNVLRRVHPIIQIGVLQRMSKKWGFNPSRVDIAIDDYLKRFDTQVIHQAIRDNCVTGVRSNNIHWHGGNDGGWTFGFGSRQSNKYLRIYNKAVESKGAIDSHRIEAEFKDSYAKEVWKVIADPQFDKDVIFAFMLEVVLGVVDFREDTGDKNIPRRPRLDWWQKLVDALGSVGGLRMSIERPKPLIANKIQWLYKQVAPTLALLKEVFRVQRHVGSFNEFVEELLYLGNLRLRQDAMAVIKLHELQNERLDDAMVHAMMNA